MLNTSNECALEGARAWGEMQATDKRGPRAVRKPGLDVWEGHIIKVKIKVKSNR